MIRPDIFVPGNHEFDFGREVFLTRMAAAEFPVFAANLRDAKVLLGECDGKLMANDVMGYVREHGEIAPQVEGRIMVK